MGTHAPWTWTWTIADRSKTSPSGGRIVIADVNANGPRACGAYWHTRAAWATMTGWLEMTARPRRGCGWPGPFWTGAGPRGGPDGGPLLAPLLPRPPPGPGT